MKKYLISLIVSLCLTCAGMYINYQNYVRYGLLKWAKNIYGGEITAQYGFGWKTVVIYGMTPEEATTRNLSFDPVGFIVTVLIFTLILLAVWKLADIIRNNSK